ncbi:hypothetical protein AHF37_00378 [Paragonimus kellicotti]|nr:hypothetical protein AHF37_00378 [Paragonimus kellicotti]
MHALSVVMLQLRNARRHEDWRSQCLLDIGDCVRSVDALLNAADVAQSSSACRVSELESCVCELREQLRVVRESVLSFPRVMCDSSVSGNLFMSADCGVIPFSDASPFAPPSCSPWVYVDSSSEFRRSFDDVVCFSAGVFPHSFSDSPLLSVLLSEIDRLRNLLCERDLDCVIFSDALDVVAQCLPRFFSILSDLRSRFHFDLTSVDSFALFRSLLLKLSTIKPNLFSKVDIEFFLDSLSERLTDVSHLACSPIFTKNIQFDDERLFITENGIPNEIADRQYADKNMVVNSSNQYDATIPSSTLHCGEKWPPAEISTACFDWIERSTLKSGITEESSDLLHDSLNTQLHSGQLRFSLTGSSHITEEELNQLHLTIADLEKQLAEKDSELADALCELRAQRAELVTSMNLYLEKLDELNEIRAENGKLKDTATEVERTHRFQRAELIKEADSLRDSLQNSENEFFLLKKELADTQRELHLVQTSAILREKETDAVSCKSERLLSELVKLRSEERNLRKIITFEQSERDQLKHEYDNLMMRFTETVDNSTQMEKRLVAVNGEIHAMIGQLSRSRQSVFASDEHWKTVRSRLLFLQNVISSSVVQSPEDDKPTELNEFSPVLSQAACQHDEGIPNTELIEESSLRKELDNSLIQLDPFTENTADFYGNHCFSLVTSASSFSSDQICPINNEFQAESFISSQGDNTGLGVLGVDKYKINSDQTHSFLNHQEYDHIKTLTEQKPTTLMQNVAFTLCKETTESTRDTATSNTEITGECLAPFIQEICSLLNLPLSQATERGLHCDKKIWYNIIACVKRLHDRYIAAQAERSRLTALLSTIRNELKQQEVATREENDQNGSFRMHVNSIRHIAKYENRGISDKYGQSTELLQQQADSAEKTMKESNFERETETTLSTEKTVEFKQGNLGVKHCETKETKIKQAIEQYSTETIGERNEQQQIRIEQGRNITDENQTRECRTKNGKVLHDSMEEEKPSLQERLEELERELFSVRSDLESASVERDALRARVSMVTEDCADWQSRLSEAERCVSDRIECAVSAAVSELLGSTGLGDC